MTNSPHTTSALILFFLELRDLLKQPKFRSILIWMVILLAAGTIFYSWMEGWSLLDSLYFSIITLTTVGYGDLSPTTSASKAFTIVYIIFGMILIAASISVLAMERQVMHIQQIEGSRVEDE